MQIVIEAIKFREFLIKTLFFICNITSLFYSRTE